MTPKQIRELAAFAERESRMKRSAEPKNTKHARALLWKARQFARMASALREHADWVEEDLDYEEEDPCGCGHAREEHAPQNMGTICMVTGCDCGSFDTVG